MMGPRGPVTPFRLCVYICRFFYNKNMKEKKIRGDSHTLAQGLAGNDQRSIFPVRRHRPPASVSFLPAGPSADSCKVCNICRHRANDYLKMAHSRALLSCQESAPTGIREMRAPDSFQALSDSFELILLQGDPTSAEPISPSLTLKQPGWELVTWAGL